VEEKGEYIVNVLIFKFSVLREVNKRNNV